MNNNTSIDPKILEIARQQVMQEQQQVTEEERVKAIEQVVSQLPPEPFEKCGNIRLELAKVIRDENHNPYWPAILVCTSIINCIEALKAELQQKPNAHANIKAFQDLMIGLETNVFWSTHKAQLWPVMNMILQANLSAIKMAQNIHDADFTPSVDQVIIDRALAMTYEIIPAVIFAAVGQQGVSTHDTKLRRAYFRADELRTAYLDKTNTEPTGT